MANIQINPKETNDEFIAEPIVKILIDNNWSISFAESCTGGLVVAKLVNVPSASKVLNQSFVTYSNQSKMDLLHVKKETLNNFGAVSKNVTKEMPEGLVNYHKANIGVSISGIAGPTGGTLNKPVGTVCFGFCINNKTFTFTKHFGNIVRNNVRNMSVNFVYKKLTDILKKENI